MPIWNLLTGLLGVATTTVDSWQKRKTLAAETEAKLQTAVTEAKIAYLAKQQDGEIAWENNAVAQMDKSWKDEWFTLLLSVPLILCFLGDWGRDVVTQGFVALEGMPDWYKAALGGAIAASFGLRALAKVWRKE